MQRYFDVVQNRQGTAVVGATVTVFDANGNLATLYSNPNSAPTSNPVYTNMDGEYAFYAANGTYTLQITATNYATETKPGVVLFDPSDSGASNNVQFLQAGTGAQVRSVQSKLRDVVSVKDFGAVGDGVADDTAAIQAANAEVATGGILYFPQGIYKLNNSVSILNKKVSAYGASFTGTGVLIAPLLETVSSFIDRAGSYLGVGKAADTDGTGKGGLLVGGGTAQSPNGVYMSLDGSANWLVAQTSKNENPTELIVYGTAGQGYATTVAGTNEITRVWGSEFQSRWVGNVIYFLRKKFLVVSVISTDVLSVTELSGAAVTFAFAETEAYNYFYTSGSGLCNVSGTTITYVSGDPFVPTFFTDFKFTLNGVAVPLASFDSPTQYTAVSAPGNGTNVAFTWQGNLNDQITTLRVQAIQGVNEENINILTIAGDNFLGRHYAIVAGLAGTYGKFRPIYMGSGSYTDFSYQHQIGCYPRNYLGAGNRGYASLGGVQGREGVRVYSPNASTPLANRFETEAAPSGFAPAWAVRGSDTNVSAGIDMQGIGELRITQDFSRTLFKFQGPSNTVNYIESRAAATGFAPTFGAFGSDADIAFDINTKGNGEFRIGQDYVRTLFKAQGSGSSVNWLNIGASDPGLPTVLGVDALSADTNVDILISPKGAGVIRMGSWTSNADALVNGYITIKDAAGNVRKLATIA